MEVKKEKVYSSDQVNVISLTYGDKKDKVGINYKVEKVIILPYTRNAQDVIEQIGIIKEFNPLRPKQYETLITETEEDSDDNSLDAAIRGLEEESGYKVIDQTRWLYLDELYTSKITDIAHDCYAVDITGINKMERKPDGEVEEMSTFTLVPLSHIIKSDDCHVLSLIMKLFVKKYGNTFAVNQVNNI